MKKKEIIRREAEKYISALLRKYSPRVVSNNGRIVVYLDARNRIRAMEDAQMAEKLFYEKFRRGFIVDIKICVRGECV